MANRHLPQDRPPAPGKADGSATGDLASRIDRLRGARQARREQGTPGQQDLTGASKAMRFASEFVAAIVVGAAIGFGIDSFAGTTPWGLIVLMLVGFAAGVLNVIRVANEFNSAGDGQNMPAATADRDNVKTGPGDGLDKE